MTDLFAYGLGLSHGHDYGSTDHKGKDFDSQVVKIIEKDIF